MSARPADLLQVIALGCADALNLKPVRVGGLTKAARIRDLALAAGLMILVDEPQGSDLATCGMVQLAATIDPDSFLATSFFTGDHMPMSYRPHGREADVPTLDGGTVTWNDAPGLGLDVDESVFGAPFAVFSA